MEPSYTIEGGCIVGYFPGIEPVRVSLKRAAQHAAAAGVAGAYQLVGADWSALDGLTPERVLSDDAEVGWGFLKKVGKGLKKFSKASLEAVRTTVRIAHKVTHNKVFEKIHHQIQAMVPMPFKVLVDLQKPLQEATVKFVEDFSSGKKSARAIGPAIRAAARGLIKPKQLAEMAQKVGANPKQVQAVASLAKLEVMASQGNRTAQATKNALELLHQVKQGKPGKAMRVVTEANVRRTLPGSTALTVVTHRGHKYRAILIPIKGAA